MKTIFLSGVIIFAIALSGCADNSGPYDGTWSYNSEKTIEIEGDFMKGVTDMAGNMRYENLKIRNNKYKLNIKAWDMKADCEIIGDTSEGNCLLSNDGGDEGGVFSIVDGSLYIVHTDINGSKSTYVLDKK